jgi:hypothetical protein
MIDLRFPSEGPAYDMVKHVADRRGYTVHDYLLECIAEGHRVVETRVRVLSSEVDFEIPAFERRPYSCYSAVDVEAELRRLREVPLSAVKPSTPSGQAGYCRESCVQGG